MRLNEAFFHTSTETAVERPTAGPRTFRRSYFRQAGWRHWVGLIGLFTLGCGSAGDARLLGSGTVEAVEVLIQPMLTARVLEVRVDEGDTVRAGDTLAVLDVEGLVLERQHMAAQFEELRAQEALLEAQAAPLRVELANLREKLRRTEALMAENVVARQQIDDLRAQVEATEKQIRAIEANRALLAARRQTLAAGLQALDYQIRQGVVTAPIDGVVLVRYVQVGEVVSPQRALLKLADLRRVWVRVYLTSRDLETIRLGMPLELQVEGAPRPRYTGRVVWISPQAEFTPKSVQTREARATLVYAVKIELENPTGELKIGMPADALRPAVPR
ncbi:Multidrug resistance protein MdtN [bacterium HR11]|nr:Multidrug resistance protein MdtN [bacterium HR11]